jgi:uncharacterized surface protein with fasciclin (FAS1) repeats
MNPVNNAPGVSPAKNLLDTAALDGKYVTFGKAIEKANLGAQLRGPGPFTIFAPTDEAFAALPAGTLDSLLADPEALKRILLYHVVTSMSKAARWPRTSASGRRQDDQRSIQPVKLADGKISIGGQVIAADITRATAPCTASTRSTCRHQPSTEQRASCV